MEIAAIFVSENRLESNTQKLGRNNGLRAEDKACLPEKMLAPDVHMTNKGRCTHSFLCEDTHLTFFILKTLV